MTKRERLERLGAVRLFEGLSKTDLRHLLEASRVVQHHAGHVIITEGETGAGFQLILDGAAKIVRGNRTVATLGPGDFFGEMSLIDGGPRTATVTAATELTTLAISAWDFRAVVKRRPDIAWSLLVHVTGRLRESQAKEDTIRA